MRRNVVNTDATGRSFQLAGLLLVGACVLGILVHALAYERTSISASGANKATEDASSRATASMRSQLLHAPNQSNRQ